MEVTAKRSLSNIPSGHGHGSSVHQPERSLNSPHQRKLSNPQLGRSCNGVPTRNDKVCGGREHVTCQAHGRLHT
eukprot:8472535-Prorocentrum_lima.AAC.1